MNIGEWIYKRALTYPQRPFLKQEDREFTNRQFNARVNQTARALTALGVNKGERVATLMVNSSEFLEVFFACAKTGAMVVPINLKLALPEMGYIIKDAAPRALIYSAEFVDKAEGLKAASTAVEHYLQHGGDPFSGDPSLSDFTASFPEEEPIPAEEVTLKDPLVIMYTSGTTGDPKGAVLSHENFLFGAIHSLIGYGIGSSCKSLVVAPLFHIGALVASATPVIYAGGSLVLKSFDNPLEVVELICAEKINYMFAVPVMFDMMAKTDAWERADFSHVEFLHHRRGSHARSPDPQVSGKGHPVRPGVCHDRNPATDLPGSRRLYPQSRLGRQRGISHPFANRGRQRPGCAAGRSWRDCGKGPHRFIKILE